MKNFNVSGKLVLILFISLFPSFMWGQSNVVLDKLTTLESYKKAYETNTFDNNDSDWRSNKVGEWNGVTVKDVEFFEEYFRCSVDNSVKDGVNEIITYLEKTYPNNLIVDEGYYERTYKVITRAFSLKFTIERERDDEITDKTKGTLRISYTKVVDNPLANLSDEIKPNENGVSCFLEVECYNVVPTILADGIPILPKKEGDQYSKYATVAMNKYILNKDTPVDLTFVFTPGIDEDGNIMAKIPKDSFTKITIEYENMKGDVLQSIELYNNKAYVTDTIVENGKTKYSSYSGTRDYIKKDIRFSHQIQAPVDYQVKGWSNGKDLRKEKNIEQRIKQFYAEYAALVLNKDINRITQLLYSSTLEKYTYYYNSTEQKSYHDYEDLEYMLQNIFKVVTAKDTKLYISNNGQLAYLESIDKTSYLKAVGLDYIENISFMFYIDKNTNELKIIR